MTDEQAANDRPPGPIETAENTQEALGDAFSAAFDGGPTHGMDPYVRLVPPADEDPTREVPAQDPETSGAARHTMFDPHDIERREYRLLARALTNDDDSTDHLAAMTLVQLVKFLRAAGVSMPRFPATPETPDPGPEVEGADLVQGTDSGQA